MDTNQLVELVRNSSSDDELLSKLEKLDLTPELLNTLSTDPEWIGFAPIHWTMFRKFTKSSYYLFEKGADVNIEVENFRRMGWTPLFYAISNNDLEMIKYLLKRGGDATHTTPNGGILEALFYDNMRIIKQQFESFTRINNPSEANVEALLATLRQDHLFRVEILNILLDEGVDVNIRDQHGCSTFVVTCRFDGDHGVFYPLVNEMVEKKLKHIRSEINKNDIELFTILVYAGFTILTNNLSGATELMYLTESGNLELIKLFVLMGQDPNAVDRYGEKAEQYAADLLDFKVYDFLKSFQRSLKFEAVRSAFLNKVDLSKLPELVRDF